MSAIAVLVLAGATWVVARALSPEPDLAYPDTPEVPMFATALGTDEAYDDDLVGSRLMVVDIKTRPVSDLLGFYKNTYSSTEGWRQETPPLGHELCLVNRTNQGFTEIVDVIEYHGLRVPIEAGRHLVIISRMQDKDPEVCGAPLAWITSDLL